MKVASLAPLVLGAVLAGCTLGGDSANPNLLAPKILLDAPRDGNATVYVHSAFGEHDYEWLTLQADNVTLANRTGAFSLEERVPSGGFYLSVRVGASGQVYEMRGRVDLDPARQKVHVAFHDGAGAWDEPRTFSLPFERLLDRVATEAPS